MILRLVKRFSSDPYHLLGLKRTDDFQAVKTAFFKLAAQYHPDINPSPQATKHFLLVKEAFEQIKLQKGLSVQQTLQSSKSSFSSVRPNAQQYNAQFKSEQKFDPKTSSTQAGQNQQYANMKSSFQTLHQTRNMDDIKIKVDDSPLPDTDRRLNLNLNQGRASFFNKQSNAFIIFVVLFGFSLVLGLASVMSEMYEKQKLKTTVQILSRQAKPESVTNPDFAQQLLEQREKVSGLKEALQDLKKTQRRRQVARKRMGVWVKAVDEQQIQNQ